MKREGTRVRDCGLILCLGDRRKNGSFSFVGGGGGFEGYGIGGKGGRGGLRFHIAFVPQPYIPRGSFSVLLVPSILVHLYRRILFFHAFLFFIDFCYFLSFFLLFSCLVVLVFFILVHCFLLFFDFFDFFCFLVCVIML